MKVAGRQVDPDAKRRKSVVEPAPGLAARLAQHPCVDLHDEPGLLGDREERVRAEQPVLGVLPADQHLDPGHLAVDERDLGLEVDAQLVAGERPVQIALQLEEVGQVLVQ